MRDTCDRMLERPNRRKSPWSVAVRHELGLRCHEEIGGSHRGITRKWLLRVHQEQQRSPSVGITQHCKWRRCPTKVPDVLEGDTQDRNADRRHCRQRRVSAQQRLDDLSNRWGDGNEILGIESGDLMHSMMGRGEASGSDSTPQEFYAYDCLPVRESFVRIQLLPCNLRRTCDTVEAGGLESCLIRMGS